MNSFAESTAKRALDLLCVICGGPFVLGIAAYMDAAPDIKQKKRLVKYYPGCSRELLCRCKYFETERIEVTKGFSFSVIDNSFQVLMCLDGYAQVEVDGDKPVRFSKGDTVFLPAGIGRCLMIGDE